MVARPTQTPTWATDANYPAGADAWSGTPTRVEPAAAQKGTGHVPAERPPAQFFNWLSGLVGDWLSYFGAIIGADEEHTYQSPKPRECWISPASGMPAQRSFDGSVDTGPQWQAWVLGIDALHSVTNAAEISFDLTALIPSGCTLTKVEALIDPGIGRSSGRSNVYLTRRTYIGDTPPSSTTLGMQTDNGGGASQRVSLTGLNEVIDRSDGTLIFTVEAGNDAGAHVSDVLYGVRVYFTDPGPRNA